MSDDDPGSDILLPGRDPDPAGQVEKRIKVGWSLVGMFFTLGIFAFLLQRCGMAIIPESPTRHDYSRIFAFVVAVLNVGAWVWFPVEDLSILRQWVRTRRKVFPASAAEFYSILLTMCLLILLMVVSLRSAVWYGIVAVALYTWDALGFKYIQRHVAEAVDDARAVIASTPSEEKALRSAALDVIDCHWALSSGPHREPRRLRSLALVTAFLLLTFCAAVGARYGIEGLMDATFTLGATAIVAGEVWISYWRTVRDRRLAAIREELRSILYDADAAKASSTASRQNR
jgi:hypothetical protein